jgi:cytochrome oxidase Cu insertion factor (SCO1/SenC/PrrC family)
VKYQKKELERSALGYVINHTADIYLVDTVGMLIQRYPHDVDPKVLIRKIRSLFQDQG